MYPTSSNRRWCGSVAAASAGLDVIDGEWLTAKKLSKHNSVNRIMVKGKRRNRPIIDMVLTFAMSIISSILLNNF